MNIELKKLVALYPTEIGLLFKKYQIAAPVTEKNIIEAAKQNGAAFVHDLNSILNYSYYEPEPEPAKQTTEATNSNDIPTWSKIAIAYLMAKEQAKNQPAEAEQKSKLSPFLITGAALIIVLLSVLIYLKYVKKS